MAPKTDDLVPRKSEDQIRDVQRTIRYSQEEFERIQRAAKACGYSNYSTWIRETALRAADIALGGKGRAK